jgi:peptidoglycan hydrolase-like protein with peptidoglycan-binding domain
LTRPSWFTKPILTDPIKPDDIEGLKHIQRVLHCNDTGKLDEETKLHIRGFQRMMGLRIHGAVDEATASAIDAFAWRGL